ncbi:MAG: hypothetical protein HQL90_15085 [Magnetococcales bacterium]|nr:hypothetical protein [Magnetococcales bacterium]
MAKTVLLTSEEEAWQLFEEVMTGKPLPPGMQLEFNGWPTITVRFSGPSWHETVPARMLQPVFELQREIYQAYAVIKHGDKSFRLSKDEKDRLEILLRIRPGSSILDTLTSDAFNQLAQLARDVLMPIDQNHLLGLVVVVALTYGSRSAWLAWLRSRQEMHLADLTSQETVALADLENKKMIALSEQETRRLELLEQFRQRDERSVVIQENADEGRRRMLAAMRPGDEVDVAGIRMNREEATFLTRNPRQIAQPARIDGIYRILQVDASNTDRFILKVQNLQNDPPLAAVLPNINISTEMQNTLQSAEWERKLVRLEINARSVGGRISNAEIVSCIPEESSASQ